MKERWEKLTSPPLWLGNCLRPIKDQAPISQAYIDRDSSAQFPKLCTREERVVESNNWKCSLNGGSDLFAALLSACACEAPGVCRQVFQMYLEFEKYCTTSGVLKSLRIKHVD